MAERNFSIRLAVIDGGKVKAELVEVGATGEKALKRIESAAQPASRALLALDGAGGHLRGSLEAMTGRLGPLGAALTRLGPAGLATGAALGGLGAMLVRGVQDAAEAELSYRRLEAVLRATGHASGLTGQRIKTFAEEMERSTLASAEAVQDAAAVLATFRSVSGDTFTRTLRLAQDLSAVFGQDLRSTATQLGKALEDPITGLAALRRVGVSFTESQRELIRSLVETGDVAEAQRVILDALERQVGGAGIAEAGGVTGAANRLSDAWGNLLKAIGGTPAVAGTAETSLFGLARVLEFITGLFEDEPIVRRVVEMNERLIHAQDRLDRMLSTGAAPIAIANQRRIVDELRREVDALIEQARAEADRAADEQAKAEAGRRQAEAERLAEQLDQQRSTIDKALGQLATDPAERIARVRSEIEELRKRLEALKTQGADPAGIDAALQQLDELQRRRIEAIERPAREAAERTAAANAKVIDGLARQLAGLGDERRAFIDQALSRLSQGATAAERAEVERLAGALFDEKEAREALTEAQREDHRLREEGKRLIEQVRTPAEDYAATLERLNALLAGGAIDQKTFNRAVGLAAEEFSAAQRRLLDESRAWQDGLARSLKDYADSATNAARAAEEVTARAFRGMEDALVDFVSTGKIEFASLADAIIADLARIAIRQAIIGPLASALGGLFGGGTSSLFGGGTIAAAVAHAGGEIGRDLFPHRSVSAALFREAPRLHLGGFIGPNEVPAILERGERVLSRREAAEFDRRQRGDTQPVIVNFNLTTPDAASFRQSAGQTMALLARAVEQGSRNR
jgi:phage-related minor tail protein